METPERPDRSLPSPWTPQAPVPAPYAPPAAWEELADPDAQPSGGGLTPKLVLRALRRHWWQIALFWIVGSVSLMLLAYKKIDPTYEATTWLKVVPAQTPLGTLGSGVGGAFMDTQVELITSPDVLQRVTQDPKIAGLPMLRTLDPETTLREKLQVAIPPKTELILISLSSTVPGEAAQIVNAVAQAYLQSSKLWVDESTRQQITQVRDYKERFKGQMDDYRQVLEKLAREGTQADPRDSTQEALNAYRMYRGRADQITWRSWTPRRRSRP